ncbi:sushi, von Willebrand factor type A, EGF and pentraxin domain-containing protein 1-like [Sphaerodactylus townsendi]|uniref:sushi, von Willebrand factor type A, EGF and pentraxin domain-containing protein 1-like n=1 Tax=Sphaerodactylus townsendi TaxID=933632 RepID=UPI002025F5F6|nr:sushi, von Willebrand factor type A, EGF and pentraxin domain-containing protein 1-like [Sphaerodactylus townsendi]
MWALLGPSSKHSDLAKPMAGSERESSPNSIRCERPRAKATLGSVVWKRSVAGPLGGSMHLGLLFFFLPLFMFPSAEDPEATSDSYWSGTAPFCFGSCRGKHKEVKRSPCGDGSCCWFGSKAFCRVNCGQPEVGPNSMVYGNDWWVNSVVRYSCQPGFLPVGDPVSVCQSDGYWTPKLTCLRICLQGRVEISKRDVTGGCSSTCPDVVNSTAILQHDCVKISACVTKPAGWIFWFSRCDFCECDCYVPCADLA